MIKNIGQYEIISRIGEGGMGIVYLARDIVLNRDVALKLLNFTFISDSIIYTRFLREAELLAGLNHPHIVSIYGTCTTPPYIAMQYLSGGSLRDRLNRAGRLPEEEVKTIAIQTASALAAAHQNGIIHRDIKPENILFDALNLVKVVDFGIAKVQTNTQLTLTGQILGTSRYMSPEQFSGHTIRPASDIYNFGVMLHEMITGTLPPDNFIPSKKRQIIKPVSSVTINKSLKVIISRCLEPNPDRRFSNASELHATLNSLSLKGKKHLFVKSPFKRNKNLQNNKLISKKTTLFVTIIAILLLIVGGYRIFFNSPNINHSTIQLSLHTKPEGSYVYINGTYHGNTPLVIDTSLINCHVALQHDGYADTVFDASTIKSAIKLNFVLRPLFRDSIPFTETSSNKSKVTGYTTNNKRSKTSPLSNYLQISSEPSGASVNIDRLFTAQTPCTWKEPASKGDLHCNIQLQGYRSLDTTIEYRGGSKHIRFNLLPKIIETSVENNKNINYTFTVLKYSKALRNIYENRLIEIPELSGNVTVEFFIGTSGEVINCSIIKTEITDNQFLSTIIRDLRTWNFGKTGSKELKTFTYTFPFMP